MKYILAGKTQAAFYRAWKGRVKGRDWYDFVWFIRRQIPLNLATFSLLNGLNEPLTREQFLKIANDRIDQINIQSAIDDIINFVKDQEAVQRTWSKDFFRAMAKMIVTK